MFGKVIFNNCSNNPFTGKLLYYDSVLFMWVILFIEFNMHLFFLFQIIGRFKVEYYKFSSLFDIEACIAFTTIAIKNNQIYKSLFDNVTCGKENMELRYSISRNLYNISIHLHCDNTSEVHNVTKPTDGKVELYCGKPYFLFLFPRLNKRNNNGLTLQQ